MRIGIVANEPSGDTLGAGLMKALRQRVPDMKFEGMGGAKMAAEGCRHLYSMVTVMGLAEVLKYLPQLLFIRRGLISHFVANPPDLFIGIDAPDFNLGLEQALKQAGIPTVHYVCPTVWAWRQGRLKQIRSAVNLMLSVFPFEEEFLQRNHVPVTYVGHPLADEIPLVGDQGRARERLGLPSGKSVIALLPGSRLSEIETLAGIFFKAAKLCHRQQPNLQFLLPYVNEKNRQAIEAVWQKVTPELQARLLNGKAHTAMQAADLVLTASGTATLEALLLKRPMVVAYRLSPLTYWTVKRFNLIKTRYIAMANLLANEEIAPEFIQREATPENLSRALLALLASPQRQTRIREICQRLHTELKQDASNRAADAVLKLARTFHQHNKLLEQSR